jgi:hypothetical protein
MTDLLILMHSQEAFVISMGRDFRYGVLEADFRELFA